MLENIIDTYGEDIKEDILENKDIVLENYNFLQELNITSVDEIFQRYITIFLDEDFKNKVNKLISNLGEDYIEKIEENISIFDSLL
ncbi:MAG: hypothetical protein HXK72_00535 [Clostridiales bacterium]|nr:hypothetical protein [Clostridiales bacterium]